MSKYIIKDENKENLIKLVNKLSDEALHSQAIVLNWNKDSVETLSENVQYERAYWHGCLLMSLLDALKHKEWMIGLEQKYLPEETAHIFHSLDQIRTPENWAEEVRIHPEMYHLLVDKIDEELKREDQWVYIFYNNLEEIPADYVYMLLQYWNTQNHRLRRICPRIFLQKS